jgi:uncharacterized glyoxalase superfamily protein PhnB
MTSDPFDALREPVAPLAPRPAFAEQLRRRVAAELGPDREDTTMPKTLAVREYTPARMHTLQPYIAVSDPASAIEWYTDVFEAVLLGDPIVMPDGRIGHAELRFGDSVLMLAGDFPEENHLSPTALGGSTVALHHYVPDVDRTFARAVELGATPLRPVTDSPYGHRGGVLRDPFGHRWMVQSQTQIDDVPVEDAPGRRLGDVGYITFNVPDGDRLARFFRDLFGWDLAVGYRPGAFHVESITPPAGIDGGHEPEARVFFRVDDLEAVAARVRALGGQVLSITDYESGGNAECVDDQGLRFDLFRPRPGY